MKQFIYSLMTDKRKGVIFAPFKWILYSLSLVYGIAIFFRKILYRLKIFKTRSVPMRVVSVGNLTLGGTGKTPFTITLARILSKELKKEPCVLIRGYGWDEQAMLKRKLPDVPILVGENRVKAARRALRLYGTSTAILDDGFQYWEMARDLNIVLVDSKNLFGNGHLFPRGVLREPRSAIKRADVIVFTKVNKPAFDIGTMKIGLKNIKKDLLFLEAVHKPKYLYDIKQRKDFPLSHIKDKRIILLSSIGDPAYFEETVRDLGANVLVHIAFPDHHDYRKKDINNITKKCGERKFDILLTTEKDIVKLTRLGLYIRDFPVMTLTVEMDITSGREELIARLHSLYNR